MAKKQPVQKAAPVPRTNDKKKDSSKVNEVLPGARAQPTKPDETWRLIATARAPAFDQAVPAYLLDKNYYFLDWNVAFDELVAKPLNLHRRSSHASKFIRMLDGWEQVWERSREVFGTGNIPLVDCEPLTLNTEKYGSIEFEKIAVQISNDQAQLAAWSVYLNICRADREQELWNDLQDRLKRELNWSRYALSYDKLLLQFDDYVGLVNSLVKQFDGCRRVLDLGAGTGNATLALLRRHKKQEVWAVESNHVMLEQLISKIDRAQTEDECDYFSRLHPVKEDIQRLSYSDASFDGALLLNVLYAVERPGECLKEVARLLVPGGKVCFSTSHHNTNVDRLFTRMKQVLIDKHLFEGLRGNFEDARQRHRQMEESIKRDSVSEIESWVESADLKIVDQVESYVDAVVVITAEKI